MNFDWGASGSNGQVDAKVQWAAFYSDCEHEVLEVTKGHRITLTYNLFVAPGIGDLAGNSPAMDVKQLPLFNKIKAALEDPNFMPEGGNLGIFCQHAYAHSTREGAKALPKVFKGADMAVYSVFKKLGVDVTACPIFDLKNNWMFRNYDPDHPRASYEDTICEDSEDESAEDDAMETLVRESFGPVKVAEVGACDEPLGEILDATDGYWVNLQWLNKPSSWNVGFVHMTYGNQAGVNELYTSAALVITIPEAAARQGSCSPQTTN